MAKKKSKKSGAKKSKATKSKAKKGHGHKSKKKNPDGASFVGALKTLAFSALGALVIGGVQYALVKWPQKKMVVIAIEAGTSIVAGAGIAFFNPAAGAATAMTGLVITATSAAVTPSMSDSSTTQGVLRQGRSMQGVLQQTKGEIIQGLLSRRSIAAA